MRKTLGRRILLSFSLLFFIVLLVVTVVLYYYVGQNERRNKRTDMDNHTALLAQQLETVFDNANRISVRSFFSKNIMNALSASLQSDDTSNYFSENTFADNLIASELFKVVGMDITELIVNFYNNKGFYSSKYYPVSWPKVRTSLLDGHLAAIEEALTDQIIHVSPVDGLYWTEVSSSSQKYISFARKFRNYTTQKISGTVEILIPEKVFSKLFSPSIGYLSAALYNFGGDLLYAVPSETPVDGLLSKINLFEETFDEYHTVDGTSFIIRRRLIDGYNLWIVAVQVQDTLYFSYLAIIVASGALLYAISLGTYVIMIRRMVRPLNRIVSSLRNVSWNSLEMSLDLQDDGSADLDVLQEAYSAMYRKLNESVTLLINSRLSEQRAIYLALQSQISPHFIYNTIANISACAYENGVDKIVDICEKLSGLLRYASDYSEEVSNMANELEYTRNYLDIMSVRYEGRFFYSIDCDGKCQSIPIPRLIIQTIIENCFKHAFPHVDPPWYIRVYAYLDDGWWIVDVHYNGLPLPDEQLQPIIEESARMYNDVASGLSSRKPLGLGLLNSITRLRLYCSNTFRFESLIGVSGEGIIRFGGQLNGKNC